MLNSLDATLRFQEQALKVHSQRQQLIASNIANADTPNYKAADINFADALRDAQSGVKKTVVLQTSAPGHIASAHGNNVAQVVYSTASQPAADGNTVEMDAERARFADNAVRYETAFRFLNQQIKGLLSAIQG
ncbi:MAG: flagellar basal body rod protein FlgB [Pseudomonadota bacterium]